jgi:hypothetical protein
MDSLPLSLSKAQKIPGIIIALINTQKQSTIEKDWLMHEQSFKWAAGWAHC